MSNAPDALVNLPSLLVHAAMQYSCVNAIGSKVSEGFSSSIMQTRYQAATQRDGTLVFTLDTTLALQ